jgi:hypothetical protein
MSEHKVYNELIIFKVIDGYLYYRTEEELFPKDIAPDEHVREMLGWTDEAPLAAMIHSTSWRYGEDFTITWAVYPDPANLVESEYTLLEGNVARGEDPVHPVPEEIPLDAVASHAARHLAFLVENDPIVAAGVRLNAYEFIKALARFKPEDDVLINQPKI